MRTRANYGVIGASVFHDVASPIGAYTIGDHYVLASAGTWPRVITFDILLVGGGGGGTHRHRGGGGAGGVLYSSGVPLITGSKTFLVVVGAGGTGSPNSSTVSDPTSGANSTFANLVAYGGGANNVNTLGLGLGVGGSGAGGGATDVATPQIGYDGVPGQGNRGGYGAANAASQGYYVGGGGGGAGAVGGDAISGSAATPGNGGMGVVNPIAGSTVGQLSGGSYYLGGGGGGGPNYTSNKASSGGLGGGGGSAARANATSGTENTGGGGGCGSFNNSANYAGGNGGSGVVILRYQTRFGVPKNVTGNPVVVTDGEYYVYTFTSSGSITL